MSDSTSAGSPLVDIVLGQDQRQLDQRIGLGRMSISSVRSWGRRTWRGAAARRGRRWTGQAPRLAAGLSADAANRRALAVHFRRRRGHQKERQDKAWRR